ncbi:tRNA (adenosine(37)-N6)-threonylcarbamoyltransferase complex ATPase subunit type 1 TsaE [Pelotomaculum terephthalicicum JT]|uniref:tRNA (adenosine(37)-N6)-threonylcarbamoyltransferase complex ATPase subunit type 1 TsaE n=1 Tax=Pelotomaculum terephthalicicum TaxID=206393 RepID=UPI001F04A301|nr:tRNA (adenosine(37)-N6)-threonylcarbamoyltransferase complex ATPase subunit type 1 TsaE [Pelotomaculum terephthalicicum]MCG9966700.1 tRNA (adenosine(37)-N6)-threonylcarbamoyltransferase complex ATPase subunit type 1 TsaE [Pelotomaculum terephthalicicum JT]
MFNPGRGRGVKDIGVKVLLAIKTTTPEETACVGEKLGALLRAGDVVCLNGDLGAGKTRFAQGVACGMEVAGPVTSPTFTLINEYQGRLPLYHMDFYRLEDALALEDLGYEEYFYGNGATVIEWAERVAELLPEVRLDVFIDRIDRSPESEDVRKITFVPYGEGMTGLIEELMDLVCAGD